MSDKKYSYTIFDDSQLVAIHVHIDSKEIVTHKAEPKFKYEERLRKLYSKKRAIRNIESKSALKPGFPNDFRYHI